MDRPEPFRRALGLLSLTALGLNSVIGTGIFLTPGDIADRLNGWSVPAFALGGILCYAIALCFAEMAALVPRTGGAYAYALETFGPMTGFLVGWVIWLSALLGWAAVSVPLADLVAGSLHLPTRTWPLLAIVLGFSALNARGTREGAWSNLALTAVKFVPLGIFLAWTAPRLTPLTFHPTGRWLEGSLFILYTFSGFEEVPVPAGETVDPQRTIPAALAWVLGISTVVYMLVQAVVCSLGGAGSAAPLQASVAGTAWLTLVLWVASTACMASVNASIAFTGPRSLWALTHERWPWLGTLHPDHDTPVRAIGVTAVLVLILAWGNTFERLATLSVLASLLQYLPTVLAVIVWRWKAPDRERAFRIPGGYTVPLIALAVCLGLLSGSGRDDLKGAGYALLAGLVLYGVQSIRWR